MFLIIIEIKFRALNRNINLIPGGEWRVRVDLLYYNVAASFFIFLFTKDRQDGKQIVKCSCPV